MSVNGAPEGLEKPACSKGSGFQDIIKVLGDLKSPRSTNKNVGRRLAHTNVVSTFELGRKKPPAFQDSLLIMGFLLRGNDLGLYSFVKRSSYFASRVATRL